MKRKQKLRRDGTSGGRPASSLPSPQDMAAGDTVQNNMVGKQGQAQGSHGRTPPIDTNEHIVSIGRDSFWYVRRCFQALRSAARKAE
ncbi:unnamed protein product [Ectocarpus sp. 8 AP-2014]